MNQIIFLVIAAVLAIAATVLAFIFIVPEKRREKMNAFGRFLQDLCSFKFLVVEKRSCRRCISSLRLSLSSTV